MDVSLDELFQTYTEEQVVREATALPTVLTGRYRLQIQGVQLQADDREDSPTPGRQSARLRAAILDRETGERRGTIFFSVSWEPYHVETETGRRLDTPSRLWGQLVKALGAHEVSVGEILRDYLPNRTLEAVIRESFRMPDGSFRSYRVPQDATPEERVALVKTERDKLLAEGGEPVNFVQSIFAVKA